MVGCRYGIAVFTRKEDVTSGKIEPEFNPNVSLELGFMLSRGKKVLILKDSALETLNADLMGHLYKEFDLRRVKRDLPCLIQAWGESIAEHAD
jgi:predicted nucleotide-binding protein